jgi:hypothetical protein
MVAAGELGVAKRVSIVTHEVVLDRLQDAYYLVTTKRKNDGYSWPAEARR